MPEHPPPNRATYNVGPHRVTVERADDRFDVYVHMFPGSARSEERRLQFDAWEEASSWLHGLAVAEEERATTDEQDRKSTVGPKQEALTRAQEQYAQRREERHQKFLADVLPDQASGDAGGPEGGPGG